MQRICERRGKNMKNYLEILKREKILSTIIWINGDITEGYIYNYDELGIVYTISIEESGPSNPPHFVPWLSIKEITM